MGVLAVLRTLFGLALLLTLVCLLAPADAVLATKLWAASWLPMAAALDAADASAYSDKFVHAGLFALLGALAVRSWLLAPQRLRVVVGLLLLGLNAVRRMSNLPVSGFGTVLGVLALGAGISAFLSVEVPIVAIGSILLGLGLLARELGARRA